MKNTAKFLLFISLFSIFVFPLFSFAESSNLIPCGTEKYPDNTFKNKTTGDITGSKIDGYDDVSRQVSNPCGFNDLLTMVNKVVHFVLFVMVVPIAAILFAYAGFMLITSGGEVGKKKKALSVFWNVGLGLIIAVAAWLIISTILSIVGFDGSWIGF
ncbi:MAG: hypothetical protein AAB493_00250 [Patescibacteria group bacterium]